MMWSAAYKRAVESLGMGSLDLAASTLYGLRHGGASHEMATQARTVAAIKKRDNRQTEA